MKRRDLLKGIGALPLSLWLNSALPLWATDSCPPARFESLKVALSGPFALVVQKDNAGLVRKVFAFTPVDPDHYFSINGSAPINTNPIALSLAPAGLVSANGAVQYKDDFGSFDVSENKGNVKYANAFVYIDLPCPDRLIYVGNPATAHLQSTGASVYLPLNHVLLYQIDHSNGTNPPIKITSSQIGDTCLDKDTDTIVIEVGRKQGLGGGTAHAVQFFNKKLLPCVPDVHGLELSDIAIAQQKKKPKEQHPLRSIPFGTTLECKNGGLLVTTS